MKKKITFSTELSYIFGLIFLAVGTAFMEASNFGVSMIVAPAYILHLKISEFLPFFSFGMAEYTLQAVLLILLIIVLRRFKVSYLFSFVTAIVYGFILDGSMMLVGLLPCNTILTRVIFWIVGFIVCAVGVSLLFHTYISPEVYELFVKEFSSKFGTDIHKTKTVYDCISLVVSVILSFVFFGLWQFRGVSVGTLVAAVFNGLTIGCAAKLLEHFFEFKDSLGLRHFFEK